MKLINVLSFDCAYRSLAFVYATINIDIADDFFKKKQEVLSRDHGTPELSRVVVELCQLADGFITVHKRGVIDVLMGARLKDVDDVVKAKLLQKALEDDVGVSLPEESIILIEKQPQAINTPSSLVQSQIILYYMMTAPSARIVLVPPKEKNKISFAGHLGYASFAGGNRSRYVDNKKHTKTNLEFFLEAFGLSHLFEGIKKANYDDFADAFMQIMVIMVNPKLIG